jgi:catechol 2,3-dioxygenase-like lactoylglutathione lyase family enzyme
MDMKLEVVVIPVSDIDRSLAFYRDKCGFNFDHDVNVDENSRIVQLTPPGSGCSIVFGTGVIPQMEPGILRGLQLVVKEIEPVHADLVERGLAIGDIQLMGPADMDGSKFAFFSDPDGNGWAIQEYKGNG